MGFSTENGYTPVSIETIISSIREGINAQFEQTYTPETFLGTNFYKLIYAIVQRMQTNEIKTSEIFVLLQQYFAITNEAIERPVVTPNGLIKIIEDAGFKCSVKPPEDADAGKAFVCVDKQIDLPLTGVWEDQDFYDADRLTVCTILKNSVVAGVITQGTEVESLTLTNTQSFDFKYDLPDRIPVKLRLTTTLSENNQVVVGSPDDVKLALFTNIKARYDLGKDFEPERYFNVGSDAPWCSQVLLEWSTDGGSTYFPDVFEADYNEVYTFELGDISLVEE